MSPVKLIDSALFLALLFGWGCGVWAAGMVWLDGKRRRDIRTQAAQSRAALARLEADRLDFEAWMAAEKRRVAELRTVELVIKAPLMDDADREAVLDLIRANTGWVERELPASAARAGGRS